MHVFNLFSSSVSCPTDISYITNMSAFAAPNVSAVNKAGVLAFEASGLEDKLKASLASSDAAEANAALAAVKDLCEGVDQWIEPYVVDTLPLIMDCLAQPKTSEAAMVAGNAILHKSNGHSIRVITSLLYESFTSMKWQTKKGALVLLGALGTHHPTVVKNNLPEMILKLIGISSDVKKEVRSSITSHFYHLFLFLFLGI